MESNHQSLAATAISPDAEKRALNSLAADIGVTNISEAADKVKAVAAKSGASGDNVRVLTLADYKEAALSLAEAFRDDHSSKYFTHTPDRAHWTEEQRWELHLKVMEYITYAHLLKGLVVSAGPNYGCVGLWMPPGENMDDYATILRSGMWRLQYQLSKEGRKRFFNEFLPLLGDTKAQIMGDRDLDSWYLVYIGTRPSGRGKGYARKVIDYVTDIADEEGRACYLESSNAVNLKIYGKMGFKLRKQVYLQREMEQIQLDIMVREPKMGSDADSGVDVK
ncbi:Putative GNAT domain, acyl-CoA N-acyltransferase [Septoria linicola]|uniref:GNAT domain, acyl-CoA N-acyltransferase n=1 Tax=Septoria linicola TaxID=215465 RepID=A0A9Q9ENS5_9PEZI|nr:putative GNAT domain, acyl-CoA N-acyltransferase [Septoria linicola]USW56942.1 Putative GNAT domain, acyl-CoA N-acyltransferase [Septoria linicola]